jgi:hypothetical protein
MHTLMRIYLHPTYGAEGDQMLYMEVYDQDVGQGMFVHICVYVCVYMCVGMCLSVCIRVFVCVCVCVCVHTHTHEFGCI